MKLRNCYWIYNPAYRKGLSVNIVVFTCMNQYFKMGLVKVYNKFIGTENTYKVNKKLENIDIH